MAPVNILDLDHESLAAWPCLEEHLIGEWRIRFGGGVYGRSNSVTTIGSPGVPFREAIDQCAHLYRERSIVPMFRVPHIGDWHQIDRVLEERGYELSEPSEVQIAPVQELVTDVLVSLRSDMDAMWLDTYLESSRRGAGREDATRRLLGKVNNPRRFALAETSGRPVAVGLGSIVAGRVWIFCMATCEEFRGQGYASRVAKSLLSWAHSDGAGTAVLQVAAANDPAIRLYRGLGFEFAYAYHYRRLA